MNFPRLIVSICVLAAALALAACGGDDAPVASEATTTAAKSREPEQTQDVKHLGSGIRAYKAEGTLNPVFEVDGTPAPPKVTVPPGPPPRNLVVKVLKKGVGDVRAKWGQRLTVHHVGVNYKTKERFETFWGKDNVFSFTFGSGEVRDGWETGLKGMKLGGQRELILPSRLAYGTGPLLYVVELVRIEPLRKTLFRKK